MTDLADVLDYLRSLPVDQRMLAMGMRRIGHVCMVGGFFSDVDEPMASPCEHDRPVFVEVAA